MQIFVIVPKVVQGFISQLPEVTNNAYSYFNYDHRVVNERVSRGDLPSMYVGPDEFKDADYQDLVKYASTIVNPILKKYSALVAAEDAMNMAIKSFANGRFDGKVNANKFALLIKTMLSDGATQAQMQMWSPIMAAKKEPKKEAPKAIPRRILKQLGIKPKDVRPNIRRDTPRLRKQPGKGIYLEKGKLSK
jgi:hypothetical protein